jgi:hypothetical protein
MAESDSLAAKRAIAASTFSRVKDLVRELEDNEKRLAKEFGTASIEFKMAADELAWFVAYRTAAATIERTIDPAIRDIKG